MDGDFLQHATTKQKEKFVQTRGLTDSPFLIIPDMLDWRQIWRSNTSRKGSNRANTVLLHLCRVRPCKDLLKNGSWEPLHECQRMWLQDVMDILMGCHGATDQY
ncbi:hypothetical protein TNCV_4512331 [Trichonephila clavipes]|nr:hypothetical protein TNCV_4512331 [Trichonephila clavipes]